MTRLGCVPYANALPLVALFEDEPGLGVEVAYDVPSRLPEMLAQGAAAAVLVSSWYFLANPSLKAARGVCIGSQAEVLSVRLFSKVPFPEVRSLALDHSSMTSNALALAILRGRYGADPFGEACPPDLTSMLADHDAALLIGDPGMIADGSGLNVLDLGSAWTEWKGLPFVWALWVGGGGLDERLAGLLLEARDHTGLGSDGDGTTEAGLRTLARAEGQLGPSASRYLQEAVSYRIGPREEAALAEFASVAGIGCGDRLWQGGPAVAVP